ncbi:excalibur calcium-binding domain-containing protein [Caulobacter segnis]|uniref:excalibur calcium-binding domain-containing protein n=1 Tax=Caulobacter segnis TaxID=88688 RepID=UPI0032202978
MGAELRRILRIGVVPAITAAFAGGPVAAHPGGLNSEGCHNNRKTGDYHCHRGSSPPKSLKRAVSSPQSGRSYANCSAARAAGAAPVYRGQPGYGSHLDRDNDGIGCER